MGLWIYQHWFQICVSQDEDVTTFGYIDQDGKLVRIKIDDLDFIQSQNEENREEVLSTEKSLGKDIEQKKCLNEKTMVSINIEKDVDDIIVEKLEDAQLSDKIEQPIVALEPDLETPLPRLNASLVMKGSELLIYGGIVELGKKELTLDDCWSINLNTR